MTIEWTKPVGRTLLCLLAAACALSQAGCVKMIDVIVVNQRTFPLTVVEVSTNLDHRQVRSVLGAIPPNATGTLKKAVPRGAAPTLQFLDPAGKIVYVANGPDETARNCTLPDDNWRIVVDP